MYTFFVNSPFQSVKGVNLYWRDDYSSTLTSSNNQVLGNIFMFRESEKGLKENSNVSLFRKILKESEKVIKVCSLLKNDKFSWKIQFLHKNLKHYTYLFKISKNAFKISFLKWKKNKLKIHLFEKTYKNDFFNFIFTVQFHSEK